MTGGEYYNLKSENEINGIISNIKYEKANSFIPIYTMTPFIFVVFALLLIEWALSNTRFRILP
jgi:hypothetical protein